MSHSSPPPRLMGKVKKRYFFPFSYFKENNLLFFSVKNLVEKCNFFVKKVPLLEVLFFSVSAAKFKKNKNLNQFFYNMSHSAPPPRLMGKVKKRYFFSIFLFGFTFARRTKKIICFFL